MIRVGLTTLAAALAVWAAHGQTAGTLAITGATVIDGTERPPIPDAVIVIEAGRIARVGGREVTAVPADAEIVDARDKFVIPGLSDVHNHLGSGALAPGREDFGRNLGQLLGWGVTHVFVPAIDDAAFAELKGLAAGETAPYPHFFGVGRGIGTIGGYRPETADESRGAVAALQAVGVDAVKVGYDDFSWLSRQPLPPLKTEVMAAAIGEAHRRGLKAYVHAPILRFAKEALQAGADGLLHGVVSDPIDDELIALMRTNAAWYVATLSLFEDCADIAGFAGRQAALDERGLAPRGLLETLRSPATVRQWEAMWSNLGYVRQQLPVSRANLRRALDAGIPVAAGTDTGFPGVVLGVSSQLELALEVEAGMSPQEAIRSATLDAARMFGRDADFGSLEPGKLADLVILDADPLADIRNVRKVRAVVKGGVLHR